MRPSARTPGSTDAKAGGNEAQRAVTPNPTTEGFASISPNRPQRHRVVVVKSEERGQAKRKRIEDHFGRQAFPIAHVEQPRSNYADEFHKKSVVKSQAIYPKHNLSIDRDAKVDFSTCGRDSFLNPQRLPERIVRKTQPHLQSNSLLTEMMSGKFEGRTEKQDQFGLYSVVLK